MRSVTLFALSFALVARSAPAPQDDQAGALVDNGGSATEPLATALPDDLQLNAHDPSDGPIYDEPIATAVPMGSTACTGAGGIPGLNCPYVNAPPDGTCVDYTYGAMFWQGGYQMGCSAGTHCDPALGGQCNGW